MYLLNNLFILTPPKIFHAALNHRNVLGIFKKSPDK